MSNLNRFDLQCDDCNTASIVILPTECPEPTHCPCCGCALSVNSPDDLETTEEAES